MELHALTQAACSYALLQLCTTLTAKACSLLLLAHSMFATGSCDGTTRIWSYKEGGWVSIVLRVPGDEMNRYVTCKSASLDESGG